MLSNRLTLWCLNAISSITSFNSLEIRLNENAKKISELLGRPTTDSQVKAKNMLEEMKRTISTICREAKNLGSICEPTSAYRLHKSVKRFYIRLDRIKGKLESNEVKLLDASLEEEKNALWSNWSNNEEELERLKNMVRILIPYKLNSRIIQVGLLIKI